MIQVPIGTTVAFAGTSLPAGWGWANSQLVATATYPRLTKVLQAMGYVASGGNIAVPDLRGRAPVAAVTPSALAALALIGAVTAVAGTPAHVHTGGTLDTGLDIQNEDPVYSLKPGGIGGPYVWATGPTMLYNTAGVLGAGITQNGGSSSPHTNLAPYLLLNFIIKLTGEGVQGYPVGSLLPCAAACPRIAGWSQAGGIAYVLTAEDHGFAPGERIHISRADASLGEWTVYDVSSTSIGLVGSTPGMTSGPGGYVTPAGWMVTDSADGVSSYNSATARYAALYGVIGTTFGGSAGAFLIPDTRGRIMTGRDNMNRGVSASLIGSDTLGASGGLGQVSLSPTEMGTHFHTTGTLGASIGMGEVAGYGPFPSGESVGYQNRVQITENPGTGPTPSGVSGNNLGGGGPHNNMPKFIAVPHLLKY